MGRHVMEAPSRVKLAGGKKVNTDLTRKEWVEMVARSFARTGPDNHPTGFFTHVAENLADEGAYDKYVYGEYPEGKIYVPERDL